MPLRWQEVAVPLAIVLILVILKYVPGTSEFPLARLAGIVSFGYAIFLALRLIQGEDALPIDGWQELRASPVELFGAFGGAAFSALLLVAVVFGNLLPGASFAQMAAAFAASFALACASGLIAFNSLLVRVRWNGKLVEKQDHRGNKVALAWSDVVKVEGRWAGITIETADRRRLSFSPLHSGAGQLATFASIRARRNATQAARAWG